MTTNSKKSRAANWHSFLPSLAAALAAIFIMPTSEWIARALTVDQLVEPVESGDALNSISLTTRDEPITPIPDAIDLDTKKIALGRALFHEPGLSRTGNVSCASCHVIRDGGDDNRKCSEGIGGAEGEMNAPTVLNSSLNFRQFWDGRAATLAEQLEGPIHNPIEMGSNWKSVVTFLKNSKEYSKWFSHVFEDGITQENITDAIVEYERSLITPNSPFDKWLKGDEHAITEEQKWGYSLFQSYECVGCHQGVNVGGNLYQPLGVMVEYFANDEESEKHLGRFNVTGDERDRHVFKVPSLRNVARTAPYFHDGSASTLDDAVRAMIKHQLDLPVDEETVRAITSFLESLSAEPNESKL